MEKRILGRTGIEVTELCFGALPMGPLQKGLDVEKGSEVIARALSNGVNFIDTAQMYGTYEPIRIAMEKTGIRPVLASKSSQKTYEGMEEAVNEALEKLGVDYIDIFHLHAARERENAFELFEGALRCLADMKKKGRIKAIGISTHSVKVTNRACDLDIIDVVFPIINMSGQGIVDGTSEEMLSAIKAVHLAGKGVYLMKVLAGGSLINNYEAALGYARRIEGYASIAVGMVSTEEVDYNINYFEGKNLDSIPETIKELKNALVFKGICKSCGSCIKACPNNAITFDSINKADIEKTKCLTCGYCTAACPEFAIRIV